MLTQKFLEYLLLEKRYSENTVLNYSKDLQDFQNFLADTEGTEDFRKADKKVIRNFISQLSENNLAKRSINRKISSLRSFYNFLLKIGEVQVSPVQSVSSLKFYPEKQIPFSEQEMQDFLGIFKEKPLSTESVLIEMLYQTGIRRAELCQLKTGDVDFGKNEITVTGKGNKMRKVPVSPGFADILKDYFNKRNPQPGHENFFFLTEKGKKISPKFVYDAVNYYFSMVSSKEKTSPHILRHTFATHLLNHGAEISQVKSLMGHSSLASTQVYTSASIEQLKKVFGDAHPRAKKKDGSLT